MVIFEVIESLGTYSYSASTEELRIGEKIQHKAKKRISKKG
ncbi:hypothetical protein PHOSAC3_120810 [Mesotoga infera]|nr:hypothetical protein PHOSAC3_120810 [Mesotoga infera]